jgi:hypothetical protein
MTELIFTPYLTEIDISGTVFLCLLNALVHRTPLLPKKSGENSNSYQ